MMAPVARPRRIASVRDRMVMAAPSPAMAPSMMSARISRTMARYSLSLALTPVPSTSNRRFERIAVRSMTTVVEPQRRASLTRKWYLSIPAGSAWCFSGSFQ